MDGGLSGNERPRTRPSGAPRRPIRRPALTPPATLRAIRYRALLHGWVFRPYTRIFSLPVEGRIRIGGMRRPNAFSPDASCGITG